MVKQNKSPITAFIGGMVGLVSFGIINPNYTLIGLLIGIFIGYILGRAS